MSFGLSWRGVGVLGLVLALLLAGAHSQLSAQSVAGGVIDLPIQSREVALGGRNVSLPVEGMGMVYQNPALLIFSNREASLSYLNYYADIQAGQASGSLPLGKGQAAAGLRYLSFGTMQGYDAVGHETKDFTAQETMLLFSYAHQAERFGMGLSLKPFVSQIENYQSYALLADLGSVYTSTEKHFVFGMVLKNVGVFRDLQQNWHQHPLDLWVGLTLKPRHMPLRFSLTSHDWIRQSSYHNPLSPVVRHREKPNLLVETFNKLVLGTELMIGKHLTFSGGLNFGQRYDFQLEEASGGVGFSYGAAFSAKGWDVSMARAHHVVKGGHFLFSLGIDFDRFGARGTKNKNAKSP